MLTGIEQRMRAFLKYCTGRSNLVSEESIKDMEDGFSIERYFVNDTYRDVTAVLRNGVSIPIERAVAHFSRSNNQVFRIRTIYKFRRMSVVRPVLEQFRSYARLHGVSTDDMEIIEKELRESTLSPHSPKLYTRKIVLERCISEEDLESNSGCFFPEEDVLVVDTRYADRVFHPNSVRGIAQRALDPILEELHGTGVLIEIVDNDQAITSRFIHLLGQTVEIKPHKDPERASGVYVIRAEDKIGTDLKSRTTFMSLEEAREKIGLHRTREEAFTGGDAKLLINERVLAAEQNLKGLEAKITERKHELELLRIDGQREEHELKSRDREEQAEYSTRKLARDDHYDSRSSSRRDTSESIKLSTVIITAAITASTALAGWYFANKKESSSSKLISGVSDVAQRVVSSVRETVSNIGSAIASSLGRGLSWIF